MTELGLAIGVRQTLGVARRILTEYARQRRTLIFWAVFPALMLLLFVPIYAANPSTAASVDTTPAGILIGAALFFSCLGGTVALIAAERERRTLRRLLVLALMVVAVLQAVLVYVLAYAIGSRFRGDVLLGATIVVLSVFSFVGLGFFFGARFARRAEDVNGPVAAFGVPLLVLAGTWFPVSLLPKFLLAIAWFDPVFHMNEALKGVAGRALGWADVAGSLWFLTGFAIFSLGLGVISYRGMLEREKRS